MTDAHASLPDARPPARPASAPDAVWEAVRQDYLSGVSAPACCRRYGVGLSALRDRAAREGWRRVDQPWTPPNRLDPEDEGVKLEEACGGNLDRVPLRELSFVAWRRMMRAIMRGDAAEALRWRRVRQALDQDEAELEREMAQEESVRRYRASSRSAPPSPNDPDDSDGVFAPSDAPAVASCPSPVIPRPRSGPGDPDPQGPEAEPRRPGHVGVPRIGLTADRRMTNVEEPAPILSSSAGEGDRAAWWRGRLRATGGRLGRLGRSFSRRPGGRRDAPTLRRGGWRGDPAVARRWPLNDRSLA